MNLIRSIVSLIVMWALGAIILRIVLGTNYSGSSFENDLKINLGIVLFFLASSGFMLTYSIKSHFFPLRKWHDALMSSLLFACHTALYLGLFLDIEVDELGELVLWGSIAVFSVEMGRLAFERNLGNTD